MPKIRWPRPGEYSTFQLAEYCGVSRSAIVYWLQQGHIPEPNRRGNKRIWTQEQADEIKRKYEETNTSPD